MFIIKNRQHSTTTTPVVANVHYGSYTANDDGEGDADHEYYAVEVNGQLIELTVDGDNLVDDPEWREIVMAAITGKAHPLSGIEFQN
jgi:hypothetical protein